LLPLAIFMLAADVFTHELESGSIKCVITRPVSRFDAYLAKCCAILCYIAITLGVGYFLSQIFQIVIYFTGADQSAAGPLYAPIGAAGAAEALAAYALTLAPMAAFIAYACFISVLIRSPALVMFLCIASYIALSVFGTFYNGAGAALFTTYTSWYRMWLGERLPLRNLAPAAGVLLSTCVALFGFGYFIFEKRDI
jgi:ABC-2 type transport system permease protein